MKDPLKPRDKITQKMSRDGLIEVNETKETAERISRREQEADFSKQPEQAAQDTAAQLTTLTLNMMKLKNPFVWQARK